MMSSSDQLDVLRVCGIHVIREWYSSELDAFDSVWEVLETPIHALVSGAGDGQLSIDRRQRDMFRVGLGLAGASLDLVSPVVLMTLAAVLNEIPLGSESSGVPENPAGIRAAVRRAAERGGAPESLINHLEETALALYKLPAMQQPPRPFNHVYDVWIRGDDDELARCEPTTYREIRTLQGARGKYDLVVDLLVHTCVFWRGKPLSGSQPMQGRLLAVLLRLQGEPAPVEFLFEHTRRPDPSAHGSDSASEAAKADRIKAQLRRLRTLLADVGLDERIEAREGVVGYLGQETFALIPERARAATTEGSSPARP